MLAIGRTPGSLTTVTLRGFKMAWLGPFKTREEALAACGCSPSSSSPSSSSSSAPRIASPCCELYGVPATLYLSGGVFGNATLIYNPETNQWEGTSGNRFIWFACEGLNWILRFQVGLLTVTCPCVECPAQCDAESFYWPIDPQGTTCGTVTN